MKKEGLGLGLLVVISETNKQIKVENNRRISLENRFFISKRLNYEE